MQRIMRRMAVCAPPRAILWLTMHGATCGTKPGRVMSIAPKGNRSAEIIPPWYPCYTGHAVAGCDCLRFRWETSRQDRQLAKIAKGRSQLPQNLNTQAPRIDNYRRNVPPCVSSRHFLGDLGADPTSRLTQPGPPPFLMSP